MEYRVLGKTGLRVSILGYGGSPLGDVFGVSDPGEIKKAVCCAIDSGVHYFDGSPPYGKDALAEIRLGEALKDGLRNKVIVATKVGQYNFGGVRTHDYSKAGVARSIEGSLKRLQTDHIDIYQVHDIHSTTAEEVANETIPALLKLRDQGKIRYIGITDYYLEMLKAVAEQVEIDTMLSFCCCDLVDTSLDEVLAPLAREKNIGLINASPLHMGLLVPKQKRLVDYGQEHDNKLTRAVARAARYCEENGTNIADLAMRFVYAYEAAATTLCGMSKVRNVERNLAAIGKKPDPELLSNVMGMISGAYDSEDPFGFVDD